MFEVKNSIDWKTAKSYFIDDSHDLYYDRDNYSRLLSFENCGEDKFYEDLSYHMNKLFGGDWKWLNAEDIELLDKHYESISIINLLFNSIPGIDVKSDLVLTSFPERLRMFLSEFSDLLNAKNQAYGNSALEPINIFSKASSSDVILQQIDHKLSRLKNSDTPNKNDVIDLMGYLTLYCLDQSWLNMKDLHK